MAPIVKGRKGHYRELFESLAKKGYIYARIDGEIREDFGPVCASTVTRYNTIPPGGDRRRPGRPATGDDLLRSGPMRQGKGTMASYDYGTEQQRFYSRHLMCPSTGIAFEDPAPHTFSCSIRPRGLPPLQRTGRGGRLRRREDDSRHGAFAARGRRRTARQIP